MKRSDESIELVLYECLAALAKFMVDNPKELVVCLEHVYAGEYGVAYEAIAGILESKPVDAEWRLWVMDALAPLEVLLAEPPTSGEST